MSGAGADAVPASFQAAVCRDIQEVGGEGPVAR